MEKTVRTIAAAALASIAMAGIGTAVADAKPVKGEMTLKFDFNKFAFKGDVDTSKNACTRNRQVRVYEKQEGEDSLVGGDKTDSGGRFVVDGFGSVNGGTKHYAIVEAKDVENAKCAEIKSKSITPNDFEN